MRHSLIRLHRPFGRYFRRKRFRQFLSAFEVSRETRVLDVGGLQYYWQFSDLLPRVTTVNLEWPSASQRPGDWVIADARMLPFREKSFEVAFSNSVIEHISDPGDRESFAQELGRVAERYYVQTPNFWFPVEPHLMTPFVHYLPQKLQRRLLLRRLRLHRQRLLLPRVLRVLSHLPHLWVLSHLPDPCHRLHPGDQSDRQRHPPPAARFPFRLHRSSEYNPRPRPGASRSPPSSPCRQHPTPTRVNSCRCRHLRRRGSGTGSLLLRRSRYRSRPRTRRRRSDLPSPAVPRRS